LFNADIFKEHFDTVERVFGWEDKFRRLLLRFERKAVAAAARAPQSATLSA
jgi:hypothetical protein